VVLLLVRGLLVIAAALSLLGGAMATVLDVGVAPVLSPSMRPAFAEGDLLLVRPIPTAALEVGFELVHEGLGVLGGGAVAGLADFGETGAALVIDDPLAGHAVAEGDFAAGDGAGDEGHAVYIQDHAAGGRGFVGEIIFARECGFIRRRSVAGGSFGGGGLGLGFADVAGVHLDRGVFELEVQIVHEKADVHVGERDTEVLAELFLNRGEAISFGDPVGDSGGLFGCEAHG
jgi:hypothetical protein